MSPEMELLDLLGGEDEPLHTALVVFGWPAPHAWERAKHAVSMMVQDGMINLYHRTASGNRIVPDWEIRGVLLIKSHWLKQGEHARYILSLTGKAVQYPG